MKTSLATLIGAALAAVLGAAAAHAQSAAENGMLADAAAVVQHFSSNGAESIPTDLLQRSRGLAVIPGILRGGFFVGARRGRGVLVVRSDDREWSNPAVVTLTGGSIGWQFGAESADVVLVLANDNSVKNIDGGKFTLGGDARAVAGPLGRHATMALTFRAEVYGYVRSRGLFAGAAFEGTRLAIDDVASRRLYASAGRNLALDPQSAQTPRAVRRFLLTLAEAEIERPQATSGAARGTVEAGAGSGEDGADPSDEARTFPLEGAR